TITINDVFLTENYSQYEIKIKFVDFLKRELNSDNIDFFKVSVDDAPDDVLKSYKNIDKINFIER
ncbi:hypothetical protein LR002_01360, partial [Candidatus Gracilibacteria bacterium]|nr:hypothetical protein [Candidatus Gracilibacteria bacterium]